MSRTFISLVIGFLVVTSLLVFQATRGSASTVLLPSDLGKHASTEPLSRIRVAGKVAEPIAYEVEPKFKLQFKIHDPGTGNGEPIPVLYYGIRPDMFAVGRDVIIDGEFKNGVLEANKLLTQCPSKYEAPSPENQYQAK